MATTDYTIHVISTRAELVALEPEWNRLSEIAGAPNAFTTCAWFMAWYDSLGSDSRSDRFRPHVLVLKRGEDIAGICPLTYRLASRFGIAVRKIEFISIHADYNDLLLGDDLAGQVITVANYLAGTCGQWDILDLKNLRSSADDIEVIEKAFARAGLSSLIFPEKERCPFLLISGDAACVMKRLSGRRRKHLRKQCERAVLAGIKVRIIENPMDEAGLLKTMVDLEWKKHLHTSVPTFVGAHHDVFQAIFKTLGPRGWLYVALLEQRDHPIAFQFGFRCGANLWDYTKAYDSLFAEFAPGLLLLPPLLDYGFERGFKEYDFLRGEEPYKAVWSTGQHRQCRLLVSNRSRRSRIAKFIYHDLKSVICRFLHRCS